MADQILNVPLILEDQDLGGGGHVASVSKGSGGVKGTVDGGVRHCVGQGRCQPRVWRMILPSTMYTTSSATFVAWSAMRSRYLAMKVMRIARVIVLGFSSMNESSSRKSWWVRSSTKSSSVHTLRARLASPVTKASSASLTIRRDQLAIRGMSM